MNYVDSLESAEEMLRWLRDVSEPLAVDTETGSLFETADKPGLQWWAHDFTRLLQFGTRDEGWAIGVREWRSVCHKAMQIVADGRYPVIFHNARHDMHALESDGLPVPAWERVHDTYVLHHLLTPHYRHALKSIAEVKWGPAATAGQSVLKAQMTENKWNWATVPVDLPAYWAYGILDTILTRRVFDDLEPEVKTAEMYPAYEREMAVMAILYRAEVRGIRIDLDYTERLQNEWIVEAAALKAQLEAAGIKNPRSNQAVEQALREVGWEPDEFTDTGLAKLDKVILKQLSEHPTFGPVAVPLIRYKRIDKWNTVYLQKFLRDADADSRIHPSINTLQARTGRMSVTGPPFQTLPSGDPSIRNCVLSYEEGHSLYMVDFQAQEARLFVNDAQDWELAQVILSGSDLYTHFAQAVYQDPSIDKSDPRRVTIKVMTLAMMYGAGVPKLALATGLSEAEVADTLRRLFDAYPSIPTLTGDSAIGGSNRGMFAEAALKRYAEEGLCYVLSTGGRRFSMEPSESYKATNGRMQSSGADILKQALVRLDAAGLSDYIVMPVHDEIVFSIPTTEGDAIATECERLMRDDSFYVPLEVEMSGPYERWGAKYAGA